LSGLTAGRRELCEDSFADAIGTKVEDLLEFVAPAARTPVRQANRRALTPYLETRVRTLRRDPEHAFQKRASIREVALLVALIESKLQFPFAAHPWPLLRLLRLQFHG
jgi:hypothetical protein